MLNFKLNFKYKIRSSNAEQDSMCFIFWTGLISVALFLVVARLILKSVSNSALRSKPPTRNSVPLMNVHTFTAEAIPPYVSADVDAKAVVFVTGDYEYWHYCLDNVEDSGWGCAYRSGQTLESWVVRQLGGRACVHSILEMQRALHEMGDKSAAFVGSQMWVGSVELSLNFHGAVCKIIHVNCGSAVFKTENTSSVCMQLWDHFKQLGGPVMVGSGDRGGGAVTVVGVDLRQPADPKLLLLDPHFMLSSTRSHLHLVAWRTGRKSNSWCTWVKARDYFVRGVMYNVCLPQQLNRNERSHSHSCSQNEEDGTEQYDLHEIASSQCGWQFEITERGEKANKQA
jgi:hypothetical protein